MEDLYVDPAETEGMERRLHVISQEPSDELAKYKLGPNMFIRVKEMIEAQGEQADEHAPITIPYESIEAIGIAPEHIAANFANVEIADKRNVE